MKSVLKQALLGQHESITMQQNLGKIELSDSWLY